MKTEEDPLDSDPPAAQRQTLQAIRHLERAVLNSPALEPVVLAIRVVLRSWCQ